MSTDLDFLPSVINHTVETSTKTAAVVVAEVETEPSEPTVDHARLKDEHKATEQPKMEVNSNDKNNNNNNNNNKKNNPPTSASEVEGEEGDPITPTSDEFKIPAPRSPPPAPRKRRCGMAVACRKKLDFLDHKTHPRLIIPKEEVIQEFFTSSFDQIHSRTLLKRRCPCI